jgi:hypothetical protein
MDIKNKQDFLARYSLGSGTPPPPVEARTEEESPALVGLYRGIGRRLLKYLFGQPGQSASLFTAVVALDAGVDELRPVVEWLERQGAVAVSAKTPTGDCMLAATGKGQQLLLA